MEYYKSTKKLESTDILKKFEYNYSNEIPVEEIAYNIKNGRDVNYDNCIIIGDLNIENLSLENSTILSEINSEITITRSIIRGNVLLGNVRFNKPIDFSLSTFENEFDLSNSHLERAEFFATKFVKEANFRNTNFNGAIDFIMTRFYKSADFSSAVFMDQAQFGRVSFNNSNFNRVLFDNEADFTKAVFNVGVDFAEAVFNREATFRWAEFYHKANFGYAKFNEAADFSYTFFYGSDSLSVFPKQRYIGNAEFYNTKFLKDAIFEGARFVGLANFNNTEISNIGEFEGAMFLGTIGLNDARISSLKVQWNSIENQLAYDERTYLFLIENYKKLGWFEDSDNCYYQYRKESMQRKEASIPKIFDYLAWISCGYGVKITHAFFSFFIILIIFALYYFIKIGHNTGLIENIKESIAFSGIILISAPREWYPFGENRYIYLINKYMYAKILERLLGWGLMAIAIVTLGKLLIR